VALEPRVAALLVEHLAASLVAGAVERGRSALPSAALGEGVGSPAVTILEDASLPRGLASAPFDGEARPTRPWTLVERGTLRELLGAPAGRGGERVGSASRTSFTEPPRREPANLHLARGERSPRSLLAEAGSVFRVTGASLLGRGGPASGEVVLAASGERLESGAFAGAVRGVTLVGRLRDVLAGVLEAGNDLSFHLRGSVVGSPTLLIDGMWVA
jgi:PmbA protein